MNEQTVLGLLGPAGSGKDLVADWLGNEHGFMRISFADPMKRFVQQAFGLSYVQLWGPSEERNKTFDVDEAWWFNAIGRFGDAASEIVSSVLNDGIRVEGYLRLHDWLTNLRKDNREGISTRVILQTLGTEWGRAVDGLMWVNYAYKHIDYLKRGGYDYTQQAGIEAVEGRKPPLGFVIPDHRFRNEVSESQARGTAVIRLRRLALEKRAEQVGIAGHKSEAEQKELPDDLFNLVLEFPEGIEKVHSLLKYAYEEELWTRPKTTRLQELTIEDRL